MKKNGKSSDIGETLIDRVKDVAIIGILYCWYLYFKKRKRMFINA